MDRPIHLLTPDTRHGGYARYAAGLKAGLEDLGQTVSVSTVHKREWSLAGRPFLGDTSLRLGARRAHLPQDALAHATEPVLATRHTPVVTIHDTIPLQMGRSWLPGTVDRRYVRRRLLALQDKQVVVPTQVVADELVALGFEEDRIHVAHEGVDTQTFHPGGVHEGMAAIPGRHILLVGDLNPRKRWDLVLAAARDLDDVHVWHAGHINAWGGMAQALEAEAEALGHRWHRIGPTDDATLRVLYATCDLFVLPSRAEGFGLPALEAMACGAPVLVTDLPVFREVLGQHARYTDLASLPESLPPALDGRAPTAKRARVAHAAGYTWKRTAERTLPAYEAAMT